MKKLVPTLVVLAVIGALGLCCKMYILQPSNVPSKELATNDEVIVAHPQFDR